MDHLLPFISEPIDIIIEQEQSHPAEQSELVEVTFFQLMNQYPIY